MLPHAPASRQDEGVSRRPVRLDRSSDGGEGWPRSGASPLLEACGPVPARRAGAILTRPARRARHGWARRAGGRWADGEADELRRDPTVEITVMLGVAAR